MDFVEKCRKLILVDSSPEVGSKAMALLASELCLEAGLQVELLPEFNGAVEEANIIARPQSSKKENEVMFQTPIDTVAPGLFGSWTYNNHNPFNAQIIDRKIYGLGAASSKLDFLCKIQAMGKFAGAKFRNPPVLVGTYGSELGMVGALRLIRKGKVKPKFGICAEPSNLRVITAGSGYARVEIRIPFSEDEQAYRNSHDLKESTSTQSRVFNSRNESLTKSNFDGSASAASRSAIRKLFDYLLMLPDDLAVMQIDGGVSYNVPSTQAFIELDPVSGFKSPMAQKLTKFYRAVRELEDLFQQYEDNNFTPSIPHLNIGVIRTRGDHVFISGSCHILPMITNEIYDGWMKQLHHVCKEMDAEFRVIDYKRPFKSKTGSELELNACKILKEMSLSDQPAFLSTTNEASLFSRVDVECISFGPGIRDGNARTPFEHVAIDDLEKAQLFYEKLIERLCL